MQGPGDSFASERTHQADASTSSVFVPAHVAVLSLHTSPLAQPGTGDSGGMNVYVREMAASLAHRGVSVTVYVRRWAADLEAEVEIEPGVRVVHVDAGAPDLIKEDLYEVVDRFADGVVADIEGIGRPCVLHANYWLSGVAGHLVKHRLDIPLVTTFHTLARVKAETGDHEPERRARAEAEVITCSDIVTASCTAEQHWLERLYDTPTDRIKRVSPGVEHALFSPGNQAFAREAIGVGDEPLLLFVGRIQPLKGVTVAVEALARLIDERAKLIIVGGVSGTEGQLELDRVNKLIAEHGLGDRVRFVKPQPHHRLGTYYRAADVCLVPSRSESFGLVALESAACGTPVVASAVGGLRTLVDHGRTGFLVEGRDPTVFAAYIDKLLENRMLAAEMAMDGADYARRYSWTATADQLMDVYAGLGCEVLVDCA